jgi:hypothetical protein
MSVTVNITGKVGLGYGELLNNYIPYVSASGVSVVMWMISLPNDDYSMLQSLDNAREWSQTDFIDRH